MTLIFDLLIPNETGFQDSWWNISTSSLVRDRLLSYHAENQTRGQTEV